MRRSLLLLVLFAGPAAWAGAQHGDTPVRLRMLAENRTAVALLVDAGLDLGTSDDDVARARIARQAAVVVRAELTGAVATTDVDRVVELGEHLTRLYTDGLVPTLTSAADNVPVGSPARDELNALRRETLRDAATTQSIQFAAGKLAESNRVKEMARKLGTATDQIRSAAEKK